MSKVRRITQRVLLKNGDQSAITLCVEPWAEEYNMPAGAEWMVEVEGPDYPGAVIAVEREADRLIAWAWDGSDYRLLDSTGKVLDDWTGIRVPDFHGQQQKRRG